MTVFFVLLCAAFALASGHATTAYWAVGFLAASIACLGVAVWSADD